MRSQVSVRPGLAVASSIALVVQMVAAVDARQSAEPVKKFGEPAETSRRQGFSVVLLLGDVQGPESLDGVPTAARKALTDTKDFLPYKHFRLLDSQWTLCCSGTTSAITRLRGLDDQQYELELRASPVFNTKSPPVFEPDALSVRFFLRELDMQPLPSKGDSKTAANEARLAQLQFELFSLEREQVALSGHDAEERPQRGIVVQDVRRSEGRHRHVVPHGGRRDRRRRNVRVEGGKQSADCAAHGSRQAPEVVNLHEPAAEIHEAHEVHGAQVCRRRRARCLLDRADGTPSNSRVTIGECRRVPPPASYPSPRRAPPTPGASC
jgi:hypothetical protein